MLNMMIRAAGNSPRMAISVSVYRPWSLVVAMEFCTEATARRFESYLKSGSDRAFAKRHFADPTDE